MGYLSKALVRYYGWKAEKAKRKLKKLPLSEAKIKLDLKSLHITPKGTENCTLYLNPLDEGLSVDLYVWGFREPMNTFLLHKFMEDEKENIDAVIDVGSNIGYFPLIEMISEAKQIIAIEPIKETFLILQRNMKEFKNVKALNIAISDKNEIVKMTVPEKLNLAKVLRDEAEEETSEKTMDIHAFPLRDIIESEGLKGANVLVRMDVEGFEKVILREIPDEVYGLSFELHSDIMSFHDSFGLIEKLLRLNYRIKIASRYASARAALYPLIKRFGLNNALSIYQKLSSKRRLALEHDFNSIVNWIKQKEYIHIFAVKNA